MVNSLSDPFVFELIHKFGGNGYLVYFGVIEILSEQEKIETPLETSYAFIASKLYLPLDQVASILGFIALKGKFEVKADKEQISVLCPKLREFLDNYTLKKHGVRTNYVHCTDNVSNEVEVEVEVEVDKKKKRKNLSTDARIKVLIDYYYQAHLAAGKGKLHIDGGADGQIFKSMLETFTQIEIQNRIDAFMDYSDKWMKENNIPYTIRQFKSAFNKLAVKSSGKALSVEDIENLREMGRTLGKNHTA